MAGETYADGPQRVDLPGVTVALLDTVVPGSDSGTVDADQLAWLDDLSATAARPGGGHGAPLPVEPRFHDRARQLLRHPPRRVAGASSS